ncbi:MAG: DNA polymerase III subunit beta, partial [Anaerolineae bacterium]
DFVNSLPPEQIDLELVTRTQTLHRKCARTEANVKVIDAQEFPLIPTAIEDKKISLQPEALRQMIEQVTLAAATDESRPILTGVLADFQEAKLALAAADGFRLSVRSAPLSEPVPEPMRVIIPARALQELGRVAADEEEPVEMIIPSARNQVLFHLAGGALGGPIEVISQLIEGNFPDYQQIIPTSYNTRTVVDTKEFLRAAKIALLFARDAANIVRVQMTPGEGEPGSLTLAATAAEVGDNVGQIDATIEGPAMEIAFNGRYLIDILNVIDSAQVALETSTPSSPGVFRPLGDEDFVHVIMPMHISR